MNPRTRSHPLGWPLLGWPAAPRRVALGFSLVEMIVVIVILGVLLGVAAPRLASLTGREARSAAERVAELLSAAASRDLLTSQRLAVDFDATTGRVRLLTLGGVDGAPVGVTAWREDPLTPAVSLGSARIGEATVEGVPQPADRWRIELPQNAPRPGIVLIIAGERDKDAWVVELPSRSARAMVRPGSAAISGGEQAIDLDEAGQGDQPW